jgi:hypothetical protein
MHVRRPIGRCARTRNGTAGEAGGQNPPANSKRALDRENAYSHSIVPGGLDVMSKTTRLTSRISLIIREAICSSKS